MAGRYTDLGGHCRRPRPAVCSFSDSWASTFLAPFGLSWPRPGLPATRGFSEGHPHRQHAGFAISLGSGRRDGPDGALGRQMRRQYWWVGADHPGLLDPVESADHRPVVDGAYGHPAATARQYPTYRGQLISACWYVVGWILLGLHAWLLMLSLGAPVARSLPIAIGGFTLAVVLGVIFIPTPAGVGIREIALVAAFSSVLSPSDALFFSTHVKDHAYCPRLRTGRHQLDGQSSTWCVWDAQIDPNSDEIKGS